MTNLKIEAVLKATDEQIEEMIEANAFNPETEELEHFKVTISCDLNEVSMEEVLGVLRQEGEQETLRRAPRCETAGPPASRPAGAWSREWKKPGCPASRRCCAAPSSPTTACS